jgi:hypothetical protein
MSRIHNTAHNKRQKLYPKAFKSLMEAVEEISNVAIFYLKKQNFKFFFKSLDPGPEYGFTMKPASGFNKYGTESQYVR